MKIKIIENMQEIKKDDIIEVEYVKMQDGEFAYISVDKIMDDGTYFGIEKQYEEEYFIVIEQSK